MCIVIPSGFSNEEEGADLLLRIFKEVIELEKHTARRACVS